VRKANASKPLMAAGALTIAIVALSFFLVVNRGKVRADRGVTTETAAASAGAKVLPTDPKLRIEPK
jgi:hypothetical protein